MNVIADATDNAMKSQNRSTIITRTAEANSRRICFEAILAVLL